MAANKIWNSCIPRTCHTTAVQLPLCWECQLVERLPNLGTIKASLSSEDLSLTCLALKGYRKSGRMFTTTPAKVRKAWAKVVVVLGILFAGPLHSLRHTGPSNDIAKGRIGLEGARRRGRWLMLSSVQRYSKTFALVRYRARTPPATLALGERVMNSPRQEFANVLKKCR